jgi:hypothetical protein
MGRVLLALTEPFRIGTAWAGLRVIGTRSQRRLLPWRSSGLGLMRSMTSLAPGVLALEDQDTTNRAKSAPDGATGSAGEASGRIDPYREFRRHLLAAAAVIFLVALIGGLFFLS